jgi:hypothetical protein
MLLNTNACERGETAVNPLREPMLAVDRGGNECVRISSAVSDALVDMRNCRLIDV